MAAQTVHPVGVFSSPVGIPLSGEVQGLTELSRTEMAAPQLVMLANVALTSEVNNCEYMVEEKQMVELKTVGSTFSDSEEEDIVRYDYDNEGDMPVGFYAETSGEIVSDEEGLQSEPAFCHSPTSSKRKRGHHCHEVAKKKKPFHCKPCQYQAECEEEFVHHIRVHSAKKLIVVGRAENEEQLKEAAENTEGVVYNKGVIRCERCGYNTNRYDHYMAHLKHHNKEGDSQRVYKCTICTYTTVSQYHWKKHLRNHFPSKLYTCSQCCYFSDRKNNYVQHIRTHTGERPFRCPYCKYSSSQKTHLTRHMRTHSGEKPFKCESCCYVAANQHEVTRHARQVHDGPKPLSCPHCEYKTADRSNYKKHVELHINPRQFLCPVCNYAASKKCNLQYHIKSRHPHCTEITMDVSRVKLRSKRAETEAPYYQLEENTPYTMTKLGQSGQEVQQTGQEKKTDKQENADGDKQTNTAALNLTTTKPTRPTSERVKEKEQREKNSKKGEEASEKEKAEKADKNKEKPPKCTEKEEGSQKMNTEKESVQKRNTEKAEEISDKAEKSSEKTTKNIDKIETSTKRGEKNSTDKLEKKKVKENKKAGEAAKSADKTVKTRPKRDRNPGKNNPEKANGTVEKVNKNTEKPLKTTTKKSVKVGKAPEKTDGEKTKESQEAMEKKVVLKKVAKTKAVKRKAVAIEPPTEQQISEHPSSSVEKKKRKVNSKDKNPQKRNILRSKRKKLKSCKASKRKGKSSKKADWPVSVKLKKKTKTKNMKLELPKEISTENEEKSDASEVQDAVQSQEYPVTEIQLVIVEEENQASEKMDALPEESSTGESLAAEQHSDVSEEKDTGIASTDPPQEQDELPEETRTEEEPRDETNETNEPKDTAESVDCSDEQTPHRAEEAPELTETADTEHLPPLELPPVSDKPQTEHMDTEDEGIHSHDGSDISDSVSEGSDDSGLNGVGAASEATSTAVKASEEESRPTPKSHTCIFCDRTFAVEGEYRRHLNRHLVNVYYLESAVDADQ
ncbi:RE1-silencing transcription factor isoform X2 [Amia ocellicauda]